MTPEVSIYGSEDSKFSRSQISDQDRSASHVVLIEKIDDFHFIERNVSQQPIMTGSGLHLTLNISSMTQK